MYRASAVGRSCSGLSVVDEVDAAAEDVRAEPQILLRPADVVRVVSRSSHRRPEASCAPNVPRGGGDRSVRSRREVEKPEPRTVRCGTLRFVDRQSEVHETVSTPPAWWMRRPIGVKRPNTFCPWCQVMRMPGSRAWSMSCPWSTWTTSMSSQSPPCGSFGCARTS